MLDLVVDTQQCHARDTVDGFCVARTRGTTRRTQRFERRGLYVGDLDHDEIR
jgi:hypothetical protein